MENYLDFYSLRREILKSKIMLLLKVELKAIVVVDEELIEEN
jgi:hypothetical protein